MNLDEPNKTTLKKLIIDTLEEYPCLSDVCNCSNRLILINAVNGYLRNKDASGLSLAQILFMCNVDFVFNDNCEIIPLESYETLVN